MKNSVWMAVAATTGAIAFAPAGCTVKKAAGTSSSSSTATTGATGSGSTGSGSTGSQASSGTTSSSTMMTTASSSATVGAGGGGSATADCNAPATAKSKGACLTVPANCVGNMNQKCCDPVTNAPCNTAGGEACDVDSKSMVGFSCYGPPNDGKLCGACDTANNKFCGATLTCIGNGPQICARYCCDNGDCGAGATCSIAMGDKVGVCVK